MVSVINVDLMRTFVFTESQVWRGSGIYE